MSNKIMEFSQYWFKENAPFGKALGYPDCCIKEFCEQAPELLERSSPTEDDKLRYRASFYNGRFSGFIPCITHAKKILAGQITLDSLIKNRDAQFGLFPHHNLTQKQ